MFELERKIVASIFFSENIEERIEVLKKVSKLNNSDVEDECSKKVIDCLVDYRENYKKVPHISLIEQLPEFKNDLFDSFWIQVNEYREEMKTSGESADLFLDAFKRQRINEISVLKLRKASERLDEKDFEGYKKSLNDNISEIQRLEKIDDDKNIISNREGVEDRVSAYDKKKLPGALGIPTGVDKIDESIGGLKAKELMMICGRPKSRKTFLAIKILSNILKLRNRYKVLFFSEEMLIERIRERWESIHWGINYTALSKGNLYYEIEQRYKENLRKLEKNEDGEGTVIFDSSCYSIMEIINRVDEVKPNMVFVDGAYLLEGYSKLDHWQKMMYIVRDLKKICKKKDIPMIATWQLNRSNEVSFSDSVIMDSDFVIDIEKDEESKNLDYVVRSKAIREGSDFEFKLRFDINECEFYTSECMTVIKKNGNGRKLEVKEKEEDYFSFL